MSCREDVRAGADEEGHVSEHTDRRKPDRDGDR